MLEYIKNYLKILFPSMLHLGLSPDLPSSEIKKIKVLNFICWLGAFAALFFIILDAFLLPIELIQVLSLAINGLVFFFCLYLQSKKKYLEARLMLVLLSAIVLFVNANFSFPGFYGEYNYVFLPLISIFFLDKKAWHIFFLILSIAFFYVPNMMFETYPETYFGYANTASLFICVSFFVYYFKLTNQNSEEALKEQKLVAIKLMEQVALRTQANPAFMLRGLAIARKHALSGLIEKSVWKIGKLEELLENTAEQAKKKSIPMALELEMLKSYILLAEKVFDKKVVLNVSYSSGIDPQTQYIPTLILRPLVENTIAYGFEESGTINVHFQKTNRSELVISLKDDGVKKELRSPQEGDFESLNIILAGEQIVLGKKADVKVENYLNQHGNFIGVQISIPVAI